MANMQLGSGSSSSTTHRLTQSSQTLDRRYVGRPSNLAIEEAARSVHASSTEQSSARPSRLVNLRLRASDVLAAEAEPEPENNQFNTTVVPKIVEFGSESDIHDEPIVDLSQMVPAEAPIEPIESPVYTPVVASQIAPIQDSSTSYQDEPIDQGIIPISSTIAETDSQALAMNIAADYAAASLGASIQDSPESITAENDSIDTIAKATSEAIAAIRMATDPEEVAEQITSLKSFADNIKASSNAPEMMELSNTIEKFIGVAMKSSRIQEEVQKKEDAIKAEQIAKIKTVNKTTTKKPALVSKATVKNTATRTPARKPIPKVSARAVSNAKPAMRRTPAKPTSRPKLVADEDQALRKALRSVAAMDGETTEKSPRNKRTVKRKVSAKRFVLAFFCALLCVAGVIYFVGSNIPDISVKVAAMQTGIEASYPSYIPRDFSLSDISSEEGKITLVFKGPEKSSFTLTEEKSSWDSTAVLRNYVEPNWNNNYITTHEQGITIYISGSNAAWVNGGVLYKIDSSGQGLTKKQLRNIVTSL